MTDLIIEARELCAVATPGQWKRHDTADYAEIHNGDTCGKALSPIALVGYTEDADFIARSRTLIPELCDALEKAQAEIERLRKLNHDFGEFHERFGELTSKKYVADICALTARAEQAECERDAAKADMKLIVDAVRETHCDETCCFACKHDCDMSISASGGFSNECPGFYKDDCFEWRGLPQEGDKDE